MTDAEKLDEIWRVLTSRVPLVLWGTADQNPDVSEYADLIDDIGRIYGDGRRWDYRTMPAGK